MRCPFCSHEDTQVKDSRPADENASIRRRRECTECGARFTTFERDKIIRSMQIALRKRPVPLEQIEKAANSIVRQLETMGEPEVTSQQIGELVMKALARMDAIGYVRFASVYKDFCKPEDFNEFLEEIQDIRQEKRREAAE